LNIGSERMKKKTQEEEEEDKRYFVSKFSKKYF
jgi:hypothetical protein